MSLATDLTQCQETLAKAERAMSARMRELRPLMPPEIYSDLQVQLCVIASEVTRLKINLGCLRMTGDLEQRPPAVTAETLELHPGADRRGGQECPRSLLLASLHRAGDHSLDDDESEQAGSLFHGREAA